MILSYKPETTNDLLSSRAGLLTVVQMMDSLRLDERIDHHFPAPRSNRGYQPPVFIKTLMLMQHACPSISLLDSSCYAGTTPTVRAIRTHSLAKGVLMGKCKTTRRTEDSTRAPNFSRCSRIVETCARRKHVCRAFKRNS